MANMKKIAAFALLTALFAANASAQDMGKPDRIVLEAKAGSVMTSQGGEYQTASVGKLLTTGESMMLGTVQGTRLGEQVGRIHVHGIALRENQLAPCQDQPAVAGLGMLCHRNRIVKNWFAMPPV